MRISDWSSDVCSSDLGEALPDRVFAEVGSRALAQVRRAAGPAICCRIVGQSRADGIELDLAMAAQYVIFAVDQARLVSPFPQGPGAGVPGIEQADVVGAGSRSEERRVGKWCVNTL